MKIKFIINPISGTGKQKILEKYIRNYFTNIDVNYTKKKGDARKLCLDAINKNFDAIIAVGGDGTVNECIEPLRNSNTALGVIPCGSGNGFAYHIGMKKNVRDSLKQLKNSQIVNIDTCTVNDLPFINISGVGFDAHVAKIFSKFKKRGFINYIKIILKELNYKSKEYLIKYNGKQRKVDAYMISFANTSQFGNNLKISPKSNIEDGKFECIIINKFPKWIIPLFIMQMIIGKLFLNKYVEIISCEEIEIISKKTLINLDGESKKITNPIKVKIFKKSLKILKPNKYAK